MATIEDLNGKWFRNTAVFAFVDPESKTRFEPGEDTKATPTNFTATQPFMIEVDDPTKPPEDVKEAKGDQT